MNDQKPMNSLYTLNYQAAVTQIPSPVTVAQAPTCNSAQAAPIATKPAPLAYTVEEAAAALNVCPKTIRRLLDRGVLTASKALRKKLIPRSQIEGFLKATCDQPKTLR